ncbi:MAG: secretin N-terminal domain-containing protein [Armatimonadota bacterium]
MKDRYLCAFERTGESSSGLLAFSRLYPLPDARWRRRSRAGMLALVMAAGTVGAVSAAQPAPKAQAKPAPKKAGEAKPATAPAPQPGAPAPAGAPNPGQPMPMPAPGAMPTPMGNNGEKARAAVAGLPPGMIKLDFRGTDIDTVLHAYSLAYGWTIVKDPSVSGPVTIIETNPLDQKKAFQVLQAVLDVRGFTAMLEDNILKVMPLKRAVTSTRSVRVPAPDSPALDGNQVVTEVVPLSNAEAASLAKDLQPLLTDGANIIGAAGANALIITDAANNIERLKTIINSLDKGAGNNELEIFRLKHVTAKKMTQIINDLFGKIAPRGGGGPAPMPGQPQPVGPDGRPLKTGPDPRPAVAAVEDERTNSVIVVGSEDNLARVKEIVEKLDNELNPHNETRVFELKFANAAEVAKLINDALVGRDEGQNTNRQPSFGFFNPFGGQQQQEQAQTSFQVGGTRIVADTRTNNLIVTADEDTMKTIEGLLEDLDRGVEYETTTFSIKLKNAHAEDMAYVLSQAFGTQQQNLNPFGFFGGFFGNQGAGRESRRDRRIRRRVNSNDQRTDASLGGDLPRTAFVPDDGRELIADASRPEIPEGARQLAQFFYDYYYGGNRRGSDATTGRTSDGRYVNLLQLRNNVLVTPERNTNSLIITTSPENVQAVKDLIADLDIEVKQVLLEAIVAEVTLDNQQRFGVEYLLGNLRNQIQGVFPVLPGRGPISADPLGAGFRYTVIRGDLTAMVTAIGRDERVRILSTPRIFTSNNQEAEIDITDSIPYLEGNSIGFGGQVSTSVDFLNVGLILNVTPRITEDGMVTVDVYQEDSNLIEFRNVGNGAVAPVTTQRVTDTSVALRDGDTLVLSGLQRESQTLVRNKIPVLGDIPVLGNLFRNTTRLKKRTELVVFLTPRVVNNSDEARALSQQELDRIRKTLPGVQPSTPEAPSKP